MNWFTQLLTDNSLIAHAILVYAFVISLGMALGRVKIFGVSLGITFVLFVALMANYGGITVNATVLAFARDFGLILFVFFIGLQVGPSFFSSFKSGGVQLNNLTLLMVVCSIVVTLGLFFAFSDTLSLAQFLGIHFGAVTNTPGLGATQEALSVMGYKGENIAVAYACAYPLGVVGIIVSLIVLKKIFHIDPAQEEEKLKEEEKAAHSVPIFFHVQITNPALEGKTIHAVRVLLQRSFICSRLMHEGQIISPMGNTVLHIGDKLRLVTEPADKEAVCAFCGQEEPDLDLAANTTHSSVTSALIRVTRDTMNGKRIRDIHLSQLDGVNITRVYRNGIQLFPHKALFLQLGDRVFCVGPERSIQRLAYRLGNQEQNLQKPNIVAIFLGILVGVIFGLMPISLPGMPVPLKLGLAGGPLIVAILLGYYGPRVKLITYTTHSANLMLREIGLALFLASIGLAAGENFVNAILYGKGLLYVLFGLVITMVPCLVTGAISRLYYKMNYHTIAGLIAGASTNAPTLAYASSLTDMSTPAISYSTVYPLAMFLRILTGQVILVALWTYI